MTLARLTGVTLGYGSPLLLDGVNLQVEAGERVALVGRNGSGKSTLLRLLAGELVADEGEVYVRQGARVARLTQEVPQELTGSVFTVVAGGLPRAGELVTAYHAASQQVTGGATGALRELERIQQALEAAGGWHLEQRVETVLSRLDLPADRPIGELSGGLVRRVLLARALVSEPDLLLLDEPTNHLDLESITWLEEFLASDHRGTLVFVTHDRVFLDRLAGRIVELDRGRLTSWSGNYGAYRAGKDEALLIEARQAAAFDKVLAQEEAWIRQGIKARRTRNEGRVRALEELRATRRARRATDGRVRLAADTGESSGRKVIEAEGLSYTWDGRPLVRDFSTTILRGDKVGLIGPNGCGKTTLLRLLLGDLAPQAGSVHHGTRLTVAYFDQLRAQLDETKSVADNVADGNDRVVIQGKPRHVLSYLADFLFPASRARTPVAALSGGERNRLLLARLFTRPANLLVMDEPTNDLDVETLELLEEMLLDFPGTVLLVSHDRAFLNHVVTSTLAFEGDGRIGEYVGGYDDWLRQRPAAMKAAVEEKKPAAAKAERPRRSGARKLTYREQRDLEALPGAIERLEAEQQALVATLGDPEVYRRQGEAVAGMKQRLEALTRELAAAYERWEELEAVAATADA